ncbi:hypothetical protein [Variovorax sp.]|jgi:hypothetical protein|uniref:hypothetical protein n=1 Tax=Variovorax sp. TaxID=1871043 RepID=UPI0037DA5335
MENKDFRFGVITSGLWALLALILIIFAERPCKLNEWGDFVAGFSAPLAFLWLVLGYRQQGRELNNNTQMLDLQTKELAQSTAALKLQADELKNSVEQQTLLVEATREQIRLDTEALSDARELRRRSALPRFKAIAGSITSSDGQRMFRFKLQNLGNTATDVTISYSGGGAPSTRKFATFTDQTVFDEVVNYSTDCEFKMEIEFEDSSGESGTSYIPFKVSSFGLSIGRTRTAI